MISRLQSILNASGADAWEVTDTLKDGREYYFIGHKLDQNRIKKVDHIFVRVYKKTGDGQFIGSAGAEIAPTATDGEAKQLITKLLGEAELIKNPVYSLHTPVCLSPEPAHPISLDTLGTDFIRVMRTLDETDDAFVNSYEIFVHLIRRRVLNSNGVDVTCVYPDAMLETVINARSGDHEIELYRMITSGTCDADSIRRTLNGALASGRDRLRAVPTPALGKTALVLPARTCAPIWRYYIDRMNVSLIYLGFSDWKPGERVMPGNTATISAVKHLDNSSANALYDAEGAPVRDLILIEGGTARAYCGNRQFSAYLGMDDSFIPGNYAVSGGTADEISILSGPSLEVVDFSDFQADPVTGSIAGEIRLGYLRDHRGLTVVTGGSVSGNMKELAAGLSFTEKTLTLDSLSLPVYTRLEGVSITGAV